MALAIASTLSIVPAGPVGAQTTETDFGMSAGGFVSQVVGGSLPGNSGRTALSHVGCTNRVPVTRGGSISLVDLDPVAVVGGSTDNRTFERRGNVISQSRTVVDEVLVGTGGNSLRVENLIVQTQTWHGSDGFRRKSSVHLESVELMRNGVSVPVPDLLAGRTIEIPGVARVSVGPSKGRTRPTFATQRRTGLRVDLLGTSGDPTIIHVGRAQSRIESGFTGGVFSGSARTAQERDAQGRVRGGPITPQPHYCKGTGGEWRENFAANFALDGVATGAGALARVFAEQGDDTARGLAQSSVEEVRFQAFPLRITGIAARVQVEKRADGSYRRRAVYDTVRVIYDGDVLELPAPGDPLDIPGVGRIEFNLRKTAPTGVQATAVRVTLLNEFVVDLGQASTYIN